MRSVGPAIPITLQLGEAVWPALCDPIQLESAIVNLVINARDAMPHGGQLTITTAARQIAAEEVAGDDDAKPGDYVEIAVSDDGPGMPPHVAKHAFEPFFTTKPPGQGTGLGLSQLYGFVRQSGGFVRLETELGRGTTVRLYLPRHRLATPDGGDAGPARTRHSTAPLDGIALVVDDEDLVREQIATSLEDLGMSVLQAADAGTAAQLLEQAERLDILVTDVLLPGGNGRQLADMARQQRPGLAVVLISGYAGDALDDLRVGPNVQVLGKPFGLDTLTDTVRAVMSAAPVPSPACAS